MRPLRNHGDRPVLITEAPINADDEYAWRRKRYLIMMTVRLLCVVGAACTFQISGWLAAAFIVGGMVLPWTAVVMANDRMPKDGVRFSRFHGRRSDLDPRLGRPAASALPPQPTLATEAPAPRGDVIDI